MGKNTSLQTKVSVSANIRFQTLAQSAGFKSGYELLQVLISNFLRVADPEHEPVADEVAEVEETEKWLRFFGDWRDQTKRLNTAKPYQERKEKLEEAVLIFGQPGTKARSVRRVIMQGEEPAIIDRKKDATINAIIRKLSPEIYKALMEIGRACGTQSSIEAVAELLKETDIPRITDSGEGEIPGMTSTIYDTPGYVRHNNKEYKG